MAIILSLLVLPHPRALQTYRAGNSAPSSRTGHRMNSITCTSTYYPLTVLQLPSASRFQWFLNLFCIAQLLHQCLVDFVSVHDRFLNTVVISANPNACSSCMEHITIPNPSAFLRKSPVNECPSLPRPPPIRSTKNPARRPLAIKAGVEDGGITKPKQSKSRNGCITCKGKRLKCDETKPTCEQCRKRNVQCGGYSKAFKWRSFEEANFTGKPGLKPKKGNTSRSW